MINKNVVLIVSIGRDEQLLEALPSVTNFCTKYNADLLVITKSKWNFTIENGYNYKTFEKNQIYDVFEVYDKVLRLDSDVIITPNCPDLFSFESNTFYVSYEDVLSRKSQRLGEIERAKNILGEIPEWKSGYFNSGVILCDSIHRDVFDIEPDEIKSLELGPFKEQTYLNWRVRDAKYNIVNLGSKFNYTGIFTDEGKYDSWIIHYAGSQNDKVIKMKEDNRYYGY
jgi:lipopolysaccharide biosynthesis glycosyltransferase